MIVPNVQCVSAALIAHPADPHRQKRVHLVTTAICVAEHVCTARGGSGTTPGRGQCGKYTRCPLSIFFFVGREDLASHIFFLFGVFSARGQPARMWRVLHVQAGRRTARQDLRGAALRSAVPHLVSGRMAAIAARDTAEL